MFFHSPRCCEKNPFLPERIFYSFIFYSLCISCSTIQGCADCNAVRQARWQLAFSPGRKRAAFFFLKTAKSLTHRLHPQTLNPNPTWPLTSTMVSSLWPPMFSHSPRCCEKIIFYPKDYLIYFYSLSVFLFSTVQRCADCNAVRQTRWQLVFSPRRKRAACWKQQANLHAK